MKKTRAVLIGWFINIGLPVCLSILLFSLAVFWAVIPELERSINSQKRLAIQGIADCGWSVIQHYYNLELSGVLTTQQARAKAAGDIRSIRYGEDMKDYLWINDMNCMIIMHPYRTDLEGTDVSDLADPNGKKLFVEFVKTVENHGAGFVEYMWQWKDDSSKIVDKLSYVRGFAPWGWIIGTGVYLQDVESEIAGIKSRLATISGIVSVAIFSLLFLVSWRSFRSIAKHEESETRFNVLFDSSFQFAVLISGKGVVWAVNQSIADFLAQSKDKLIGKRLNEFQLWKDNPDNCALLSDSFNKCLAGQLIRFEFDCASAEGQTITVDASLKPVLSGSGNVSSCILECRDISDRKRHEEELISYRENLEELIDDQLSEIQEAKDRFRDIAMCSADWIWETNDVGVYTYVSGCLERFLDYSAEEMLGKKDTDLFVADKFEEQRILMEGVHSLSVPYQDIETWLVGREGKRVCVLTNGKPLFDSNDNLVGFRGVSKDITARRIAELKLAEAARYREELNDLQHSLLKPGKLNDKLKQITDSMVTAIGAEFCGIWLSKGSEDYPSTILDVEEGIGESKNRMLESLVYSGRTPAGDIFENLVNPDRCPVGANDGQGNGSIMGEVVRSVWRAGGYQEDEFENGFVSSHRLHGSDRNDCGILVVVCRNETSQEQETLIENIANTASQVIIGARIEKEQEQLRMQLVHAQRLESVGQLAAGVAHEINTPIQFVGDNTRYLQKVFPKLEAVLENCKQLIEECRSQSLYKEVISEIDEEIKSSRLDNVLTQIPEALTDSLDGLDRVTNIVRAMKDFSHPDQKEMTPGDINRAIESTVTVARNEWKYVAEMVLDLDPDLPLVSCSIGDINQVVLNMVINAAHAIGEFSASHGGEKGKITVVTRKCDNGVEIRICDTGGGIPEKYQRRIFDHFFTTKEVGKGTGQGLAIAQRVIVDKHNGELLFETKEGVGTTFIIRLPLNVESQAVSEATAL